MVGSDESGQGAAGANAISPAQSRAARALLGWSEADLAAKAGLPEAEIRAFEAGTGDPPSGRIEVLRGALMADGIVFTGGASPGVSRDPGRGGDEGTRLGALNTENDR